MPRRPTGTVYESRGHWFARVPGGAKDYRLCTCATRERAVARKDLMVSVGVRLKSTLHADLIAGMYEQLAEADDDRTKKILLIVDGLLAGREKRAVHVRPDERTSFREFGERWTSGRLHEDFPVHVKEIDQHDNKARLENHVYPVIGDVPMRELSLDHADLVLAQPTIPKGSLRHVALVLHRLIVLAVYPGRLLSANPLPKGWLPTQSSRRAKEWLLPREDAQLMASTSIPLVRRVLLGFMSREGMRESEAARLEWRDVDLEHEKGGSVALDENKTEDPRSWALGPDVAEALRRWKTIAPSSRWVFPAEALPGPLRRRGKHVSVSKLAEQLRADLKAAGVTRPTLFESGPKRMRLRAHDLRGTFVTLALANGKTETWVQDRTGHKSSTMINLYRRQARKAAELNLGALKPLHEAIPELASLGPTEWDQSAAVPSGSSSDGVDDGDARVLH
jgi:integrase